VIIINNLSGQCVGLSRDEIEFTRLLSLGPEKRVETRSLSLFYCIHELALMECLEFVLEVPTYRKEKDKGLVGSCGLDGSILLRLVVTLARLY
jgi:hypothetical protein